MIDKADKGESDYREIAELLSANNTKPTFVLPGDNETIDRKDPEIGFQFWHKYFDRFHEKFKTPFPINHQKNRIENFSFITKDVLVIGIHKVGSKKMEGPYWDKTLKDAENWIFENIQTNQNTKATVILAHAGIKGQGFKDGLFKAVAQYKKPVIYIHADGHKWFEKQYEGLNNFYHIQLDLIYSKNLKNGPFYPPVQFSITAKNPKPFYYDRRLSDLPWHNF
jgi:hypothetical protein